MSRDRKFSFSWYGYTDGEAQAAYLERLHAKGWQLESAVGGDREERYVLLYGDRIVLLYVSDLELTDGQAAILAQRLGQAK